MKKLILILAVAALPMAVYADTPAKTTKKHAHKHTAAASPAPEASPSPEAGAKTTATKKAPAAKATPAPKASPSPAAK
jgi:hypothetical protein